MAEHFDILIIGGGPAGLTAALYARRAGKSVLVLEKAAVGGQIASSPRVENFPGILSVSGAELADRLYEQADRAGARIELEEVLEVRDGTPKTVVTDYGSYTCDALILATGMKHRSLGLPGEDTLSGISYCAVCDGAFYAGKDVAVAGGGNTAGQDALFLSELCRHVTVIHRRDTFRADPVLVDALKRRENVSLALSATVEALLGQEGLLEEMFKTLGCAVGDKVEICIENDTRVVYHNVVTYAHSFAEVRVGEALLYINSLDCMAVAINQGSFARAYSVGTGNSWKISIRRLDVSHFGF